ncbi:MAG: hypothetical protein V3T75_04725, partial [candidate division Zixibacteria bacterium]
DVESEICFKRALELDPLSEIAMTMYGIFCHKKGRNEESASLLEKAIEQGSENDTTFVTLASVYLDLEKLDEVKQLLKKARKLSGDSPWAVTMWGHFHALLGEKRETESSLKIVQKFPNEEMISPAYLGILNFDLGKSEIALPYFETALRKHDYELIYMTFMPSYKNLREDSKLMSLLNTLGLHDSA